METRQDKRNMEARSHTRYCHGTAVIFVECVPVAFVIQYAMRMRHIAIRGLSDPTKFFHIIS
jgi:hypothetical protein